MLKEYFCNYCNQSLEFKKQQHFASHRAGCKFNPKLIDGSRGKQVSDRAKLKNPIYTYTFNCKKCNEEYKLDLKITDYNKGIYTKYCSRSCANFRIFSEESNLKKSNSALTSDKVKEANKKMCGRNAFIKNIKFKKAKINLDLKRLLNYKFCLLYKWDIKNKKKPLIKTFTKCLYCNKNIIHNKRIIRKYHVECWRKCSGGFKVNSVRLNSSIYKGFKMDSGAERFFAQELDKHNIKWIKNTKTFFDYVDYNGKSRKYYPDFYLREYDLWVEIKGRLYAKKDIFLDLKCNSVPNLELIYSHELKEIFKGY